MGFRHFIMIDNVKHYITDIEDEWTCDGCGEVMAHSDMIRINVNVSVPGQAPVQHYAEGHKNHVIKCLEEQVNE
jgi:hypothetical protein